MFNWFEKLVNPFPEKTINAAPKDFWSFAWECTKDMRWFILAMTLFTAATGAFEALLFALMGKAVDWLGSISLSCCGSRKKVTYCYLLRCYCSARY